MTELAWTMISLFQFAPAWGVPDISPFCFKVENYLRMIGVDYKPIIFMNSAKGPKGKLPFIKDGNNVIADSSFIIDYLRKKYKDLDVGIDPEKLAIGIAFQRMLDEHFYWIAIRYRWENDDAYDAIVKALKPHLPPVIGVGVMKFVRASLLRQCRQQGMGRMSLEEIQILAEKDLKAISTQLGTHRYFLGDFPSSVDACVFAFMEMVLTFPVDSFLKKECASYENIVAYCARMRVQYYS